MKPVAITVITDSDRWQIMDFVVSAIPASGLLAEEALEKYGPRPDESIAARKRMMARSDFYLHREVNVATDKHSAYPTLVKQYLPYAKHTTYKGAKGAVVGQGELKQVNYDPLFCINHQFASIREGVAQLKRRTWTTTKSIERLYDLVMIFVDHYNRYKRPKKALAREIYMDARLSI